MSNISLHNKRITLTWLLAEWRATEPAARPNGVNLVFRAFPGGASAVASGTSGASVTGIWILAARACQGRVGQGRAVRAGRSGPGGQGWAETGKAGVW
jgi:hypothetical protein